MSITLIILFSFLNTILNIPTPIKIDSSTPFYITSNEILFEFDFKSEEKTEMIFVFNPYSKSVVYGNIELFTNIEKNQNESTINTNEIIYNQKFYFKGQNYNYITVNSSIVSNLGGNCFIYLIGNLQFAFEVFLLNEMKSLDLKEAYYFSNFFEHEIQNYHSLKVQNLTENIYMNIFAYNKSCSSFEIINNNQKIKCDSEIAYLFLLEKNNEYIIKYYLGNANYFSINFFNYDSNFIQSLDELSKSKSLIALSNSLFNFSINIKEYKLNDYFGFIIDYPIKFSLKGDFLEKENFDKFKTSARKIGYNYFIAQKRNEIFNYFIFKIKFLNSVYNQIKVKKIDKIFFIKQIPFSYNIIKEKTYLFIFAEELMKYFSGYNNYIKLKFDQEKSMNIFFSGNNMIFHDKIFISKLVDIDAISFFNVQKDGIFEINMLSENYNEIINTNYLKGESDKTYVQESNKGEKIEIMGSGNRKIFYCNLIMGNSDFYQIFDLSENKTEEKIEYEGIKYLTNQSFFLKAEINSYSIYEIFIQNYDIKYHFVTNSKMAYLSKYVTYKIFPSFDNMKIGIKLMNTNSPVTIISNEENKILNSKNSFIEFDNFDKIEIEGNNSLVYFFVALTNSTDYLISESNDAEINNIREMFIVPQKTEYDIINLIITITQSEQDEIVLYYIVDYNIIPFSRNKIDLMNKITLKRDKKEYILINNYIKNDKVNHLSNETFYIYLQFNENVTLNYQLNYSNYQILKENNQILILPGLNKIYVGYENVNYLKFDKCGRQNISLGIYQNEEISEGNIIISEENDLISCLKADKEGYLSLEVNSQDNFLLSLTHQNISILDDLVYDYNIELSIDNIKKRVIINYKPVSNFPQVEYHIFLINTDYYYNLTDHCFINQYINDIYIRRFMFLSNGEEESLSQQLKIEGDIKCDEFYAFLIIAKENINGYINYHYYNPKTIFVSESICNAEPEEINDTIIQTIFDYDTSENISGEYNHSTSYFILGTDNFNYDKSNKKAYFNLYFIYTSKEFFPDNIFFYLINDGIRRNLDENENATIKAKCDLIQSDIKNQIKYKCEFYTLGENISNIKSLDIIEFNSQKIEIQSSSFLHALYKNNMQNAVGSLFNKPLYILEDSIINSNQKEFNITGNLDEDFNYTKLSLQFHPDKESENIINLECDIFKSYGNKSILQCLPGNPINTNIVDGYSNLSDRHFIVVFQKINNKIVMDSEKNPESSESSKNVSTGVIIAIILAAIIVTAGIVLAIILIFKNKKGNSRNDSKEENNTNTKFSINYNKNKN